MYIIGVYFMLTTNVTQLREELPKYLHRVQQGEHVIITSHGKAIARIVPLLNAKEEAKNQLQHLQKICTIGDIVSPIETSWDANT